MEHLAPAIGNWPWKFNKIETLAARGELLAQKMETGDDYNYDEAIVTTETLEALASIACFDDAEPTGGLFTEFGDGMSLLPDMQGVRSIQRLFARLPYLVMRLKGLLFSAAKGPTESPSPNPAQDATGATFCRYCTWAFDRGLRGLAPGGDGAQPTYKNSDGDIYYHLVAVTDWPTFEFKYERGCSFCVFLCEAINEYGKDWTEQLWHPNKPTRVQVWVAHHLSTHRSFGTDQPRVSHNQNEGRYFAAVRVLCKGMADAKGVWRPDAKNPPLCNVLGAGNARVACAFRPQASPSTGDKELSKLAQMGVLPGAPASRLAESQLEFLKNTIGTPPSTCRAAGSYLPKRLLDLGPDDTCSPILVETAALDQANRQDIMAYAALSYCWGPPKDASKQLKTTAESLKHHLDGKGLDAMSPVMLDAVRVCLWLKIRYLWIDALCIVQGDQADWEEQSGDMGRVFQNAWVTICAAGSRSCQSGFLSPEERWSVTGPLPYRSPLDPSGRLHIDLRAVDPARLRSGSVATCTTSLLKEDLEFCQWFSRAWVFQEMALSQRKVIFGVGMLYSQLGDMIFCENGTSGQIKAHEPETSPFYFPHLDDRTLSGNRQMVFALWNSIVTAFTERLRKLTDKEDVLPALSGLASSFEAVLGDRYLAGLWQSDLHAGLLWTAARPPFFQPSLSGLLDELASGKGTSLCASAPSWSWASRRRSELWGLGFTSYSRPRGPRAHLRPEFELVEAHVAAGGGNPFGRVPVGSSLVLMGRLTPLPPIIYRSVSLSRLLRHSGTLFRGFGDGRYVHINADWQWPVAQPSSIPRDGSNGMEEDGEGGEGSDQAEHLSEAAYSKLVLCDSDLEIENGLRLMVISSNCTNVLDEETVHWTEPGESRPEEHPVQESEPPLESKGRTYQDMPESPDVWVSHCGLWPVGQDAHEFATHFEDGELDWAAATRVCANPNQGRDCWGIVLCPVPDQPGKYWRVGNFFSRAAMGGLSIFAAQETERIELV
ncbi:hypothetical protein RB593_009279 [Gaeumannomyces tritici]